MPVVSFTILNRVYAPLFPLTGYALPFEIFKFVPDFSNAPLSVSDKKVVWDFGDGSISTDLTGSHSYTYPGVYPVTLTYYTSANSSAVSSILSSIKVINLINDTITLTTSAQLVQTSGEWVSPIYITRYNSWQTSISGLNNIITLAVSGNQSPYIDPITYYSNPYSHLQSFSRFLLSGTDGFTIVDHVTTTNIPLYATPLNNGSVTVSTVSTFSAIYCGTKGAATFYYVEDFKI